MPSTATRLDDRFRTATIELLEKELRRGLREALAKS
jgi:hypothetical protein